VSRSYFSGSEDNHWQSGGARKAVTSKRTGQVPVKAEGRIHLIEGYGLWGGREIKKNTRARKGKDPGGTRGAKMAILLGAGTMDRDHSGMKKREGTSHTARPISN